MRRTLGIVGIFLATACAPTQTDAPGCGDGICGQGENCLNCGGDCACKCGDGVCTFGEFCANCAADCDCTTLAATPPMGWNSWNRFQCNVDEKLIADTAAAMSTNGMMKAGYRFINIDDCWQASRDGAGAIVADSKTFPGGIPALAKSVHDLGLQFGVYTCVGDKTCAGRPGSRDHEAQDMKTYADWGVDYVKVDWCFADGLTARTQYNKFHDGIAASGREIVLSLCDWGVQNPWVWGGGAGQLWRTSNDISDGFISMYLNLTAVSTHAAYAGPGHWNDPDMLEVGNGKMTDDEYRAHMSLWAILSAPLIAGCDLRTLDAATRAILLNPQVIAVNQDPLGLQGQRIVDAGDTGAEVWEKPLLLPGNRAVVVFNPADVTVTMALDGVDFALANTPTQVVDAWTGVKLANLDKLGALTVAPHASRMLLLMGGERLPPAGTTPVSALAWTYQASAQGDIAKDKNHEGGAISLRGQVSGKGIGALAGSVIVTPLGGKCSKFTAQVGIDDAAAGKGSSAFQVWVDGKKRFDSGILTGTDAAKSVDIDLSDAQFLKLVTTAGEDSEDGDDADWAGATVTCE